MKKRCNYLTKADIEAIGGKIATDEEFRHVKGETAIWVSNYARIISKRRGTARILKTVFQKGYHRLSLFQYMRGHKVRHSYYVHVLVAKAFCPIPEWIKPGDRLEAHHIHSVDRVHDISWINYASNIMYVPRKLHKAIDSLVEIAVRKNNMWVKMDFVSAAEYYGISPYEFLESFENEKHKITDKIWRKYHYYSPVIRFENGENIMLNIRIVRLRDK